MCCCCCRFCCGAPTTDERIHAPVLHDASQITYCRYWGRASLPPITSIMYSHESYRVAQYSQRRKSKYKTFPRKRIRKPSKNNLARVAEGSPARFIYCCAGVACRLDVKLKPSLGAEIMMRNYCPIFLMRSNSWLWTALNSKQRKRFETPKYDIFGLDAKIWYVS